MSVQKIHKNLDDLERKITKSNTIVAKGDKISLRDAIKLGRKSNSIVSTLKKNTKDYDSAQPTEAESQKIIIQMKRLLELSEEQLNLLVANKARFESLKVGGLVKKNMAKTSEASSEQEKVMLEKTPANLKPEAEQLATRRKAAFEKATAAFAQSVGGEDQDGGEDDSD